MATKILVAFWGVIVSSRTMSVGGTRCATSYTSNTTGARLVILSSCMEAPFSVRTEQVKNFDPCRPAPADNNLPIQSLEGNTPLLSGPLGSPWCAGNPISAGLAAPPGDGSPVHFGTDLVTLRHRPPIALCKCCPLVSTVNDELHLAMQSFTISRGHAISG